MSLKNHDHNVKTFTTTLQQDL